MTPRRKPREADGCPELSEALTVLMRPTVRPVGTFRMATADDIAQRAPGPVVAPKTPGRVQQSIRDSARGEDCLMYLPGCPGDPARTIWSHCRSGRAGKGGAIKAIDLLGAYGCTHCDAIYDGQAPLPPGWSRAMVDLAWWEAHGESMVRAKQKGVI